MLRFHIAIELAVLHRFSGLQLKTALAAKGADVGMIGKGWCAGIEPVISRLQDECSLPSQGRH